ncbi:DUF4382 domain-containing protein [Neolewinella persica]|uniref:DUF4382 domain-containing protein n=1 Tax=Neolewinella persica TaxID=70998 RepID=UPI0004780FC4|nr:DUF4382 domain-containing protein [Neolewinella persica]
MTVSNLLTRCTVFSLIMFLAVGCNDDDPVTTGEGRFSLELTDAPVDDPNVSAVFVTVADVKVDGQSVAGFSKTTIELSALQNGVTEMLVAADLEAKTYSSVEIVLDDATDAAGNSPGCYAMTNDNGKVALDVAGDGALRATNSGFQLTQGSTVATVIDFDLRKALKRTDDAASPYAFAAESRLESSLRFVEKEKTGSLSGSTTNASSENGEFIVYAYTAGSFTSNEAEGNDDDELFLNAVASARLSSTGDYQFNFLEAGDYELVVVAYEDEDNDGKLEMKGRFSVNALLGINLSSLSVGASSTTTANFTLTGLLP